MQESSSETESFARYFTGTSELQIPELSVKALFEAGAHYGHRKTVWNPKCKDFIFDIVDGVTIINLDITVHYWEKARKFIQDKASTGGRILFVGTKEISRSIVQQSASYCGEFYCVNRWLGGTLTNFITIRRSIAKLKDLETLISKAEDVSEDVWLTKKELVRLKRQVEKLNNSLGGIRDMTDLPALLIVFDIRKDITAVREANKLQIPIVGIVDTNVDPGMVTFPIPCNDDSPKALEILALNIADAVLRGKRE
ncbi:MAG: 30S ribosomal protein S2, partial [Deltaproteobacteria bacterium]|nr:30S ribosomal protein S2 [Deltaproteobacteria bacterium]